MSNALVLARYIFIAIYYQSRSCFVFGLIFFKNIGTFNCWCWVGFGKCMHCGLIAISVIGTLSYIVRVNYQGYQLLFSSFQDQAALILLIQSLLSNNYSPSLSLLLRIYRWLIDVSMQEIHFCSWIWPMSYVEHHQSCYLIHLQSKAKQNII